jgi:hypothetical protein
MKILLSALALATAVVTPTYATVQAAASLPSAAKFNGKWHSVPDGTFWSNGELPAGFSLAIELTFGPNKLIYGSVNDTNKSKPMGLTYTATLDGAVLPLPGQARYNQVSVKQLSANEFQLLKSKDGDVIVAEFWTFYPDGKTLIRRGVGKSPEGVSKAFQETFKRL